jgi:hypothetical protein
MDFRARWKPGLKWGVTGFLLASDEDLGEFALTKRRTDLEVLQLELWLLLNPSAV